jgi:hypothetical protein
MRSQTSYLLVYICFAGIVKKGESKSLAPFAIKGVIDEYFSKEPQEVVILNFGLRHGAGEQVIEKLLDAKNMTVPLRYVNFFGPRKIFAGFVLNSSSILVLDYDQS